MKPSEPPSPQLAPPGGGYSHDRVLLTGATGFLGRHLLWSLLRRTRGDGRVDCLIRAGSRDEALARGQALLHPNVVTLSDEQRARCRFVWGDIINEGLGADAAARAQLADVTRIVHCAGHCPARC